MCKDLSADQAEYREGLKKVRGRRYFLWLVILIYMPAMVVAFEAENYRTWVAVVFIAWLVLLILAVALACLVRCPGCGECFHTSGPTFLPLRRCLHCSLHINADKNKPEECSPHTRREEKNGS